MRLLLVIALAEDADVLAARLAEAELGITQVNSVGSFLLRGKHHLDRSPGRAVWTNFPRCRRVR